MPLSKDTMRLKDAYSYPEYCDIAYNWYRTDECDFIEEAIRRYSDIRAGSILDIACGSGIHLREFAKRGYEVLGLDASKEMVEFAVRKAASECLNIKCVRSDMRRFELGRKFECAICMLDSFRYLLTDEDILSHIESVAFSLSPGGLYMLDLWMPKGDAVTEWGYANWVQQDKEIWIEAAYCQHPQTFDAKKKVFEDEVIFKIKSPKFNSTIRSRKKTRLLLFREFEELIGNSGFFDYIGRFYNFDFNLKEGYNIEAIRTNIILKRKAGKGICEKEF